MVNPVMHQSDIFWGMRDMIHQPLEVLVAERSQLAALCGKHLGGREGLPAQGLTPFLGQPAASNWLTQGYKVQLLCPILGQLCRATQLQSSPDGLNRPLLRLYRRPDSPCALFPYLSFQVLLSRALPNKFPACKLHLSICFLGHPTMTVGARNAKSGSRSSH